MRFWYSPDEGARLMRALGPEGATYYLEMIAGDFVFMGFALTGDLILLRVLLRRLGWGDWPRRLLVAGLLADAVENVVTAAVACGVPDALFWLGGTMTAFKQLSAMVLLGVYAAGLSTLGGRALQRRLAVR